MQTSDLNVNNTESDHANAIFRQFQDAIFSREHTYVKTLTKIMFDLLQWQEIATLSLPKKAPFISTTFPRHFCLGANDMARNISRVIYPKTFFRWHASEVRRCHSAEPGRHKQTEKTHPKTRQKVIAVSSFCGKPIRSRARLKYKTYKTMLLLFRSVVSTFIFNFCLKKDMAEQTVRDLVRKLKVLLSPFFLYCEKQICCRSCRL